MNTSLSDASHLDGVDVRAPFPVLPTASILAAMSLLAESRHLASDAGCDPWDFAVDLAELEQGGVSRSSLRWLLASRLVLHAHEITPSGARQRSFAASGAAAIMRHSCFVIAEAGLALMTHRCDSSGTLPSHDWRGPSSIPFRRGRQHEDGRHERETPRYDAARAELLVARQVVKRFRRCAPNQQVILQAFEESGWSQRIDDPLPPGGDICTKRRLNQTIKALNSHHLQSMVRFLGDGTGEGVRWDLER
jgi:hypothetical protein